jgi:mono/diheme cytochrome c family protein
MRARMTKAAAAMIVAALAAGSGIGPQVAAQEAPREQGAKSETTPPPKDDYQRSLEIYQFRKAAQSGPERGQEIFYYKCWFCHNEFSDRAPQLTGLYRHPTLISGQPVNDETVKEKIRSGGPGMAAYKYTLSDADLNDVVAFVREKCCWNSDSPPLNPRYRAR